MTQSSEGLVQTHSAKRQTSHQAKHTNSHRSCRKIKESASSGLETRPNTGSNELSLSINTGETPEVPADRPIVGSASFQITRLEEDESSIEIKSPHRRRTTSNKKIRIKSGLTKHSHDYYSSPTSMSTSHHHHHKRLQLLEDDNNLLSPTYITVEDPILSKYELSLKNRRSSSLDGASSDQHHSPSSPIGRTLTIHAKKVKSNAKSQPFIGNSSMDSETAKQMFDLFVTTLYGYLVNRSINECAEEDVSQVLHDYLISDLMIGTHCARAECLKANWSNFIFQNPPGLLKKPEDQPEDDKFVSTLLYISKTKGIRCEFPKCACRTTQGHLRITKSETGHFLEVFTLDTNYNEVKSNYIPIGFGADDEL